MSVHDRFPTDTDPRSRALVAIAKRDDTPALVIVRPPGNCDCILGRVYRVNGLDVLTGITRIQEPAGVVHGVERGTPRPEPYAVLLCDDSHALWLSLGGCPWVVVPGVSARRVEPGRTVRRHATPSP